MLEAQARPFGVRQFSSMEFPGSLSRSRPRRFEFAQGRVKLAVLLAAGVLIIAIPARASQLYGTAVVQEGAMTIVRGAQQLQYSASATEITIEEQDLIRVRNASRIVLKTRERSTLTLGSNAILHCLAWATPQSQGVLRMLFGRFQAKVDTLAGQSFNVRTSTATIGVKGTSYSLAESSNGNTAVLGIEHVVTATGADGVEQRVAPGEVSAVVVNAGATPSVAAPEAFKLEMAKIDAPPPDSRTAADLPAEQILVEQGIVSKDALERSKQERPAVFGNLSVPIPLLPLNLEDAEGGGMHSSMGPNSR